MPWDPAISKLLLEDYDMPGIRHTEGVAAEDNSSHRTDMPGYLSYHFRIGIERIADYFVPS